MITMWSTNCLLQPHWVLGKQEAFPLPKLAVEKLKRPGNHFPGL
jgi:hypothetical protein